MSSVIREGQATFLPRARLLKLVGGELIKDDVMAVAELIKNSHDADARSVELELIDATTVEGRIEVRDDGIGMGVDELLNHWMQPAGSSKRANDRKRTALNRRVLGEKGVGRFAVDRLGRYCELVSRRQGSSTEIVAHFDWDAFDAEGVLLSDVKVDWKERSPLELHDQGTVIRISGLRQKWSHRSFSRVSNRLNRLISPFSSSDGFAVRIFANDLPDYSGGTADGFLDRAPYNVEACFDGAETLSIFFNGEKRSMPWPGPGSLTCGPVSMRFGIYDLETDAVRRVGPVQDVRSWLREWSGVSIYRDGFRVLPYGEPDDDWLRLDQRRVNNPVQRLSNNQVCGMIEISAEGNAELRDQTNRGGLILNTQFDDLRRLTVCILEIAEEERQRIRNPNPDSEELSAGDQSTLSVDSVLKALRQHTRPIAQKAGVNIASMLDELSLAYRREKKELQSAIGAYQEMSAVGHNASFVLTSLVPSLEQIERGLDELGASENGNTAGLLNLNRLVLEMRDSLSLLNPLATSVSESSRTLDLEKELAEFAQTATSIVTASDVAIEFERPKELALARGRRDYLWQVLSILLRNSLQAMARSEEPRVRLIVQVSQAKKTASIIVRDKGHGVPADIAGRIFDDGFTTREGARGIGLGMARSFVQSMGGTLELSRQHERHGWTTMKLTLPLQWD